uniref:DEK proto-oncogene n=1 Tax=Tetraodon nigroviridis TaxID=99883 RepID=H3C744_TETNG
IVEGKRAKKTVERLNFQTPKHKEKLKIGDGAGEKLGDIPRSSYQIARMKPADLKPLHAILFDRPGKAATIKKNLRLFNGFAFHGDSEEFARKRERLLRKSSFTNSKLKVVCSILDLEKKGTHSDLVDRIMNFLLAPKNSGRRLPVKRKRRSKKKLSADDAAARARNRAKASSSSRPGSKSKAIVMDSSSDEDEDEDGGGVAAGDAQIKASDKDEGRTDESEESPQSPGTRTGRESSGPDSDAPEKTRKTKPAARSKKADSSSKSPNTVRPPTRPTTARDDEPLINMVKKAPDDQELRETVRSLLRSADLEETTMKKICQRVFDRYPDQDLSSRKDYIKQTVKAVSA